MYLKSLELHGFKSFPNRTVMTFDRGATVIVGPNGSGKSNISDAMRWVLGELSSRNIRGTKMEDVIFGGASSKRPMNFAEVSVTFDNSDPNHRIDSPYEEITVTRRYYRGGDSEYMINRQKCRLRDIFELFMNTGVGREGYSIIGQGKIAEIISKKSEDRRNFFEEAAGISKFRHRKHEAENKLTATEANMLREQDILSELESRVGPLEKEAEKAKKYLVISEEKRQADVSLWLYDTQKLRDDIFKYSEQSTLAQNKLDILTEGLESLRRQVTDLEQANVAGRLKSEELLGSITALTDRMHALDNRYGLSESEISHLKSLIEQCKERIGDIEGEKAQANEEIERIGKAIADLQAQQDEVAAQREQTLNEQKQMAEQVTQYDRAIADGQAEIDRLEATLTDERVRFDVLRTTSEEGSNRYSAISEEIKGYEQTEKALQAEALRCDKAASVYRDKIAAVEESMQGAAEKDAALSAEREALFARINALSVSRDTLLERAETLKRMEEQLEGYGGGVRYVMDKAEKGAMKGTVYGPISKLIHIQNQYVTAIETALGATIQHIVVDTDDTAKEAIELLKAAKAGRCTFLPVSTIRPSGETEEMRQAAKCKGYVDRADRLTDSDKRFRPIVEWMLMRTAVFDTLENAVSAARTLRHKLRIVTLDGQIMNVGGSMTGGANASEGKGILSRGAQIDGIVAEAKKKEAELATLEKERKALDEQILDARQTVRDCEQNRELLQTMSRAQFAALDQANAKLEANRNLLSKLSADRDELQSTRSQSETELQGLSEKIADLEAQIAQRKEERAQLSVTRNGVDDSRAELGEVMNTQNLRMLELGKDIESAQGQIEGHKGRLQTLAGEVQAQQGRIEEHRKAISEQEKLMELNRAEYEDVRAESDDLRGDRKHLEAGMADYTERLGELRELIEKKTTERESCFRIKTQVEAKLEQFNEEQEQKGSHLYDEYELTYEQAVALEYPAVTKENRAQVVAALTSARNRLRAMGSVNANAVEEYREVKTRYDALAVQLNDLKKSRDELVAVIARLESEMRTNFLEAFEKINENFGIVFRELFGGGQAQLILTEPEDVLTSGIEIKAAPPGKIIKSLSLLSGGEQSFIAIALFFAIIKVNPTPFCILDEVEAALDEVNVARFGAYIEKMSDETQFIMITHRRGTMEVAQRLYGVTMPEKGISRVIGINVNEIDRVQKELLNEIS